MEKNVRHWDIKKILTSFIKKNCYIKNISNHDEEILTTKSERQRIMEDTFDICIKSYLHLSFDCNPNY